MHHNADQDLKKRLDQYAQDNEWAHKLLNQYGAPRFIPHPNGGTTELTLAGRIHYLCDPENRGHPRWEYLEEGWFPFDEQRDVVGGSK